MPLQPGTRRSRGRRLLFAPLGGSILVLLVWGHAALAEPASSALFPLPDALRPNVTFWKRVFAVFDTNGGLLHDMEDVTIVYHIWYNELPTEPALRQPIIDEARSRYRAILDTLADGKRLDLTPDEERVWALFKGKHHALAFRAAANNIRFQGGMRSRFAQGVVRSWSYLPEIQRIFADYGLPAELTLLPHIESSFENRALSKAGAAGIWQIMPATGRRFLRVDGEVDERLNIRAATIAAAQILRENYEMLGTWPLAITAYNHGVNGMKQAVATVGTTDIGAIAQHYRGPLFGFASKNFYAEFLAAVDLVKNYKHYFGDMILVEPPPVIQATLSSVEPPRPAISRPSPGASPPVTQTMPLVVSTPMPVASRPSPGDTRTLANVAPSRAPHPAPLPARGKTYQVRRGDTLSTIAERYDTTVAALAALNGLKQHAVIKAGQTLVLPATLQSVASADTPPSREPVVATVKAATPLVQRTVLTEVTRAPVAAPSVLGGRVPELDEKLQVTRGTIRVVAQEQLSHYADWLNIPVQRLRALNRLSPQQSLAPGTTVRLDFSKVSAAQFTQRRLQYHRSLDEASLRQHRVGEVATRKPKPGEKRL